MAENSRPPVAIRIVRPYESDDELLEHELETIGKTSVVLVGAHPRPTGVILRFEVTLASGTTVLRGEGRVLAHKENAFRGQPGLTLRFTRLDPRSKAVVDRATAIRDARAHGEIPSPSRPAPPMPEARVESPVADALTASTPAPSRAAEASATNPNAEQEAAVEQARASAREKANAVARANAKRTGGSVKPMALTPPPVPAVAVAPDRAAAPDEPAAPMPVEHEEQAATPAPTPVTSIPGDVVEKAHARSRLPRSANGGARASDTEPAPPAPVDDVRAVPAVAMAAEPPAPPSPRAAAPSPSAHASTQAPPDRAELLARLRSRAGALAPERIAEILSARR